MVLKAHTTDTRTETLLFRKPSSRPAGAEHAARATESRRHGTVTEHRPGVRKLGTNGIPPYLETYE